MKTGFLAFICVGLLGGSALAVGQDHAAEATQGINRLLADKSANPGTFNLFAAGDNAQGSNFAWNKNLWCADLLPFFTCFSPWNSNENVYQGGTLITPKHAIFAEHFSGASGSNTLHAGDRLVFVGGSNIRYARTLKATPVRVGSSDVCVGTFNESNLPPDVIPAQVLPPGLSDSFLPAGTPIIFCNKDKQARVGELVSLTGVVIRPATDPKRVPWTLGGPAYVGDSGSPIFALLDGRPVLLALFLAPNAGPPVSNYIDGINALLGRGYQLNVLKTGS